MQPTPQILVVDDDREMTSILSDYLTKQGYTVKTAGSAAQAFKLFYSNPDLPPDLVLSDVKMGSISGIDLTKKLVETNPGLPVVLFSAFCNGEMEKDSLQSGAVGYIHKPFSLSQIGDLIKGELTKRNANLK